MVDYRIPGISLSTVQEQDEQRQYTVAKLIEKFESHKYKEQFLQDMSQTQKINRFSAASRTLLKDVNQTEIFELCENTKKLQCPDCNSFTEVGIIYCGCGRNLKYNRRPKPNLDCNSTRIGSQPLFAAYMQVFDGTTLPSRLAAIRNAFVPESTAVNDQGRIVRSLVALRTLILCDCDCNILTTAFCFGL